MRHLVRRRRRLIQFVAVVREARDVEVCRTRSDITIDAIRLAIRRDGKGLRIATVDTVGSARVGHLPATASLSFGRDLVEDARDASLGCLVGGLEEGLEEIVAVG